MVNINDKVTVNGKEVGKVTSVDSAAGTFVVALIDTSAEEYQKGLELQKEYLAMLKNEKFLWWNILALTDKIEENEKKLQETKNYCFPTSGWSYIPTEEYLERKELVKETNQLKEVLEQMTQDLKDIQAGNKARMKEIQENSPWWEVTAFGPDYIGPDEFDPNKAVNEYREEFQAKLKSML